MNGEISADRAKAIAARYLAENPTQGATGTIQDVRRWSELPWRPPLVYGKDDAFWERQWLVYLEQPGVGLRSSLIIAIDRFTGEVGYVGSANDEG